MSEIGCIILSVFAATIALPIATGLWHMARALLAGDTLLAKRLGLPLLRLGLWLAGTIVILASHGREYHIAILLSIAAGLLQLPRDWPVIRSFLWPR